jgi:small neutral amino acid transporter SnatA (MarC family)
VSFGLLVAGFLATTNAGRVALAAGASRPGPRGLAAAVLIGLALAAGGALAAEPLLDALSISPESFRIAAGMVLAATAFRTLVAPHAEPGPFGAVLVTPELACMAIAAGATEPAGKVLAAAAVSLIASALAYRPPGRETSALAARLLAALQVVVAVALAVSGIRDV